MKPIASFTDHPSLESEPLSTIYVLGDSFYWATPERLAQIVPCMLRYTNIGEPYREMAWFEFGVSPTFESEWIQISIESATKLLDYCHKIEYSIAIDSDLLPKLQSITYTPHT